MESHFVQDMQKTIILVLKLNLFLINSIKLISV